MDLGCLDLGCISVSDKHGNTTSLDSDNKELDDGEKVASASKTGKVKSFPSFLFVNCLQYPCFIFLN